MKPCNDLSSLEGTWRSQSGNEYIINDSGEVRIGLQMIKVHESVVGLKVKGQRWSPTLRRRLSVRGPKNSVAGGFVVVAGFTVMLLL